MIGLAARARRALYAAGHLARRRLPRPVVSVGNLAVGGAGKTPHVQHLARWLAGRGLRPAVLSRGYGRRSRGVLWASGERRPDPRAVGDEPALLALTLPGVPVVVGESRYEAGVECLRRREVDVFLLDDGFQHLSLAREADLLLVDAERGLGNGLTLPFGPLREPPAHARYADALVVTKCRDVAEGERAAAAVPIPAGRPRAFSRLVPRAVVGPAGEEGPLPPPGTGVAAFCGLARNDQFAATLEALRLDVRAFLRFPDHHVYGPRDLRRIDEAARGGTVLTTEKDLVRLPAGLPFRVAAVRVDIAFIAGWDALAALIVDRIAGGGR